MSERFFLGHRLTPGTLVIEGAEAHHMAAVCRLNVDDPIILFNGDGHDYPAKVSGVERRRVIVEVGEAVKINRELGRHVQIAAPLPRAERAHFLVEKLTELGVTTFVPLMTRRSVVKPNENKRDKLERYVIEASKQCGRNVLMEIEPAQTWEHYVGRADLPLRRYLAHPGGRESLRTVVAADDLSPLALAVGPEGGLAKEEVDLAMHNAWRLLDLGTRILRVETAAIMLAACSASAP
jgi:16S rRNA (uracil1498-N3)-methyltransferase